MGSITACDSGNTAHCVFYLFYKPGGQERASGSQTNTPGQPTGGKVGGALEFDGVDDYVETDYATDLSAWTVAVWVNSSAAPTSAGQSGLVHREKNYQINWNHQLLASRLDLRAQ